MNIEKFPIEGPLLITRKVHGDARGFFTERYKQSDFDRMGLKNRFVQDNHSRSQPGVIRGLHFQEDPYQGKLVGVVRGRIWDVAVDIRPESPTFGKYVAVELDDVSGRLLWIPGGFAHGFCVLGNEPADVLYKVDVEYDPVKEKGFHCQDPDVHVPWPVKDPVLSARDQAMPWLRDIRRKA